MTNSMAICVEGTKGAGKTTTIATVCQNLSEKNVDTLVCSPFAKADLFALACGYDGALAMTKASVEANRAEIVFLLSTIEEAKKEVLDRNGSNVLIFDRGWMTVYPHLFGGRWTESVGKQDKEIIDIWRQVMETAPPTFFLFASFEVMRQRRPKLFVSSGLETDAKLRADLDRRVAMAQVHADRIVASFDTGLMPQAEVVQRIVRYVDRQIRPCF